MLGVAVKQLLVDTACLEDRFSGRLKLLVGRATGVGILKLFGSVATTSEYRRRFGALLLLLLLLKLLEFMMNER